jgi:SAM-dependent methyltransferase
MSTHEKDTFLQTYDWASDWQELPWAHDAPTQFLAGICQLRETGRVLDIGCGAGTDSVYLAGQGWDVTSLDFMPKALEYTQQRAQAAGVTVTPVEADITTWKPPGKFDLVLDHGLLHNMDPVRYSAYRQTLCDAIADDGEFVLLHWHPLYPGQPQGKIGPTRKSREEIKAFFAPEFQERFFAREEFEDLTPTVGGGMTQAYYWFRRNQADLKPDELIEQIQQTLARHDVDYASMLEAAGDGNVESEVTAELLAIIVGPGRLGINHVLPEAKDVSGVLAAFAEKTRHTAGYISNLLHIFASEQQGNICITNAKCTECDVRFCKRLRNR